VNEFASGVSAFGVVLEVGATDDAVTRTLGVYGSAFPIRSRVPVTCKHCLPTLPPGPRLTGYDPFPLSTITSRNAEKPL